LTDDTKFHGKCDGPENVKMLVRIVWRHVPVHGVPLNTRPLWICLCDNDVMVKTAKLYGVITVYSNP